MTAPIRRYDPYLDEEYTLIRHESGLKIYVIPKSFSTSYGVLTANYGSFDNCFAVGGEEPAPVPMGVAHFLEHKLFENEDGKDASAAFASLGAFSNAYTSFDRTSYLFATTENEEACLRELLSFVYAPYFTEESVRREQKIITEEIRMGQDSPGRRRFMLLTSLLYHGHPVTEEIAGTEQSVLSITPETLRRCYDAFYDPSNMILTLCGRFTPEEAARAADELVPRRPAPRLIRASVPEPPEVRASYGKRELPVAKPLFSLGFKDRAGLLPPREGLVRGIAATVAAEVLFGSTSPFFSRMLESNLAEGISASCFSVRDIGMGVLSGAADEPERIREEAFETLGRARREGLDRAAFARAKKGQLSDLVRTFNSVEEAGELSLDCVLDGYDFIDYADALRALTPEDAERVLYDIFDPAASALAVIGRK